MLADNDTEKQANDSTEFDGRLKQVFMQAPGLIAILRGHEGICEDYNQEFSKYWSNREMHNQPMRQAWPELAGGRFFEVIERVYDTGEPYYAYEVPGNSSIAGKYHAAESYHDFIYSPCRNSAGVIDSVMIFGMDVTAKVQARRELAEQQLMFRNITDAAGTGLWMIDVNGNITFVNQAWIDWTGRPFFAHLGRGWIRSVMVEDRHQVIENYVKQFKNKEPYSVDFRILRKDKQVQWIAATGQPRYLADGTFAGYVGSCVDITERKNAEETIRESQERFRLIADTAPVLIWMSGREQQITFLNKIFLDFLGLASFAEYPQNPLDEHVHPDDQDKVVRLYRHSFEQQTEYYIEYRIRNKAGSFRWIAMKGIPRYNKAGVFKGYIGSGMDVTEMKEHEQIKNDFIGMASHELKTPITSIKAYVQLLLNRYKNAAEEDFTKKSLITVNKQIGRLTRLIADLLDVSKMDSGRLSLNLDNIRVNDAVKEAIEEVQHTTTSHLLNYEENGEHYIVADKDRIAQVVTNFLTNAIKYSPAADKVDVNVTGSADEVTIAVKDYGIGISEEDQKKVFNRFYRVEGKNEQTFSGFGIGLFIAAEIVKRHKGQVGLVSQQGKGTTFYFKLPVSVIAGGETGVSI